MERIGYGKRMHSAIVSACFSAALFIGGFALPIVFPHIEPWVAKYMLWLAAMLLVLAGGIWLWGLRRSDNGGHVVTQTSNGPHSPNLNGTFHGDVTISRSTRNGDTYNVNSLGVGTAIGRVDNLNVGKPARIMTPQFKVELESKISSKAKQIVIGCDLGDSEAYRYAELIWQFLDSEGYNTGDKITQYTVPAERSLVINWGENSENAPVQITVGRNEFS